MHTLPDKLVRLRNLQGLSQDQMSFFFNVSQAAYSKWENGINEPTWDHLAVIASYYKVSEATLLGAEADELLLQVIRGGLVKSPIRRGGGTQVQ